jgi:DEAD/DEAH box helicase domain-containing protein
VLVASSAPLDQYIVEHPDYFFGRSPEHAYINPDNLEILLAHLKCAAFELPIRDGEKFGRTIPARCAVSWKKPASCTTRRARGTGLRTAIPADATSLRSVSSDNFVVVDITGEPKSSPKFRLPRRSPRCTRRPSICTKPASIMWSASITTSAKPT